MFKLNLLVCVMLLVGCAEEASDAKDQGQAAVVEEVEQKPVEVFHSACRYTELVDNLTGEVVATSCQGECEQVEECR